MNRQKELNTLKRSIQKQRNSKKKEHNPYFLKRTIIPKNKGYLYNIQPLVLKDRIRVVKPHRTKVNFYIIGHNPSSASRRATRSTQVVQPHASYNMLVQQQAKMRGNTTYPYLPPHWVQHYKYSQRSEIKAYAMKHCTHLILGEDEDYPDDFYP